MNIASDFDSTLLLKFFPHFELTASKKYKFPNMVTTFLLAQCKYIFSSILHYVGYLF